MRKRGLRDPAPSPLRGAIRCGPTARWRAAGVATRGSAPRLAYVRCPLARESQSGSPLFEEKERARCVPSLVRDGGQTLPTDYSAVFSSFLLWPRAKMPSRKHRAMHTMDRTNMIENPPGRSMMKAQKVEATTPPNVPAMETRE